MLNWLSAKRGIKLNNKRLVKGEVRLTNVHANELCQAIRLITERYHIRPSHDCHRHKKAILFKRLIANPQSRVLSCIQVSKWSDIKISNMNVEIISTPMTEIRMARVLVAPSLAAAAQSTFSSVQLTPHSHLPSPHLYLGADRTLRKYLISSKIRCLVIVSSIVGDLRLLPPPTQFAHPRQKLHNILPWPSAYILVLDGGYSSR